MKTGLELLCEFYRCGVDQLSIEHLYLADIIDKNVTDATDKMTDEQMRDFNVNGERNGLV